MQQQQITIPVGLATKLGVYGASVTALLAIVSAILNGDHSVETLTAGATAAILLSTTIYGRMKQAAALISAAPTLQGATDALAVINAPYPEPQPDGAIVGKSGQSV